MRRKTQASRRSEKQSFIYMVQVAGGDVVALMLLNDEPNELNRSRSDYRRP